MSSAQVFDAIIVLGAAVWSGEQASPTLMRRTERAIDAFKSGEAPLIVASGGLGDHPPTEAEMIRRLCVENGIPDENILLEDRSTSTLENVSFTVPMLIERGAKKVLIVTDNYHLPRSKMCFRHFGLLCEGRGAGGDTRQTPFKRWIWHYCREIVAMPYYWVLLRSR